MKGFSGKLKDGREIYIPHWPADVSIENLSKAGQYIGVENIIRIAENNIAAVIVSIAEATDSKNVAGIVKHFVCTARVDGEKITPGGFDSGFAGKLDLIAEIFALVVHAQYHDFFESGLAKAQSPDE
jgi:hypothetical protein